MLQHFVAKCLGPSQRRAFVPDLVPHFRCRQRKTMHVVNVSQGTCFYKPITKEVAALKMRIKEITEVHVHYGVGDRVSHIRGMRPTRTNKGSGFQITNGSTSIAQRASPLCWLRNAGSCGIHSESNRWRPGRVDASISI